VHCPGSTPLGDKEVYDAEAAAELLGLKEALERGIID
jgi:hypothetical protein